MLGCLFICLFCIFIRLYDHHHNLILHFYLLLNEIPRLTVVNALSHLTPRHSRKQPLMYFLLYNWPILGISYQLTHIARASFTQHIFKFHSSTSFLLLSNNIIFHDMDIQCFVYYQFGLFYSSAVMNNTVLNIRVKFLCGYIFQFFFFFKGMRAGGFW